MTAPVISQSPSKLAIKKEKKRKKTDKLTKLYRKTENEKKQNTGTWLHIK